MDKQQRGLARGTWLLVEMDDRGLLKSGRLEEARLWAREQVRPERWSGRKDRWESV